MQQLFEELKKQYDLTPVSIEPAPRGFAAEAFYVYTAAETYFLKVSDNPRRQPSLLHGLKVLDALRAAGIEFIPRVIHTRGDTLFFRNEDSIFVLFHTIPGHQTYDFERADAFEKLAQIYQASARFSHPEAFHRETFSVRFIEGYRKQVERFFLEQPTTPEAADAVTFLSPYRSFITACADRIEQIARHCRDIEVPFYMTHSDLTGNVMVSDRGEQWIIDFDEAAFGPMERDGFILIPRGEYDLWLSVIHRYFPHFATQHVFLAYYFYERFIVDMGEFMEMLYTSPDQAYRKKILNSLQTYLMDWLYPALMEYVDNRY